MVPIHLIEKIEINFMEGTNHYHITQHNTLCIKSSHTIFWSFFHHPEDRVQCMLKKKQL